MHQKLKVIIVTYNSEKHIELCIDSLIKSLTRTETKWKIEIIDNRSNDKTIEKISKYQGIVVKKNKKNIGFGKAVNTGLKDKNIDYFILLNPDTIVEKDAISNMVACAIRNNNSIIGGAHWGYTKKRVLPTAVTIPDLFTILFDYSSFRRILPGDYAHKIHYYLPVESINNDKVVGAVSGGFMLIPKKILYKIGFFDEKFFMYLEDVDLCQRANSLGIKVIYCPNAKIRHFAGGSSNNKYKTNLESWSKSREYYAQKYFKGLKLSLIKLFFGIDNFYCRIKSI